MTFKLFTLNTEVRKHLDRWVPFLEKERPDIICLQETFEDIVVGLADKLGYQSVFYPRVSIVDEPTPDGIAILSRFPIVTNEFKQYDETKEVTPKLHAKHTSRIINGLTLATLRVDNRQVVVGTTHFTWTEMAQVSGAQRQALKNLLAIIEPYNELIMAGDFNSPRGSEIFDKLATNLVDNVPAEIESTIDPDLHRAGKVDLVVDSIFTTPNYKVLETKVLSGLSDHKAIESTISL